MHMRRQKHQRRANDLMERGRDELIDFVESVAPTVESTLHDLSTRATPIVEKGQKVARKKRKQMKASLADALPEPVVERLPLESPRKKRRKLGKLLLLGGLGAAGVVAARKVMDSRRETGWQSAYPSRPSTSPTGSMPTAGPAADSTQAPTASADDRGAASLGEAMADESEHAHRDTTPDDPAYVEQLDGTPPAEGR